MGKKIDTVSARAALPARHATYWHRIVKGAYVGYRKLTRSSPGTWWARWRDEATGKQTEHALGALDEFPDHERFDKASVAARAWFDHLDKGGATSATTIRVVCERYVEHLQAAKPMAVLTPYAAARRAAKGKTTADVVPAADDAESRFKNYVLNDAKFAATDLAKLTPIMVEKWRTRLQAAPTRSGGNRGAKRTASTLNRDMSCLRAALNLAYTDGLVTSDFAWRGKLRPIKDADRKRELYLDKAQRRKFIDHAAPDLALFLRGLSVMPLRPGALAALNVADLDRRMGTLLIRNDKAGAGRTLKLPKQTAQFFEAAAKDKLPGAPLLARADGQRWNKDAWKWPVKAAARAAKLPEGTTAYTLRHSTISDLVHNGLDLLTAAQISGTSVAMIERHYGHLRGDVAAAALARLEL